MTYDELVTAVSDYCENTFVNTVARPDMDTMIRQAEQRIFNSVQVSYFRKNMIGSVTSGNKYLSTPDDFLSTYSIAIIENYGTAQENYLFLLNKDVNFIREAYPGPADTGLPKHYAIFGPKTTSGATPTITNELTLILGPTPDATYRVELHYYYYPESIVDAADGHTWLGDNFDIALFCGTMMEAITYMKGEADLVALYKSRYEESMFLLKNLGDGKQRMDAYRDGQVRNPVV
jgi:hypothetical protein